MKIPLLPRRDSGNPRSSVCPGGFWWVDFWCKMSTYQTLVKTVFFNTNGMAWTLFPGEKCLSIELLTNRLTMVLSEELFGENWTNKSYCKAVTHTQISDRNFPSFFEKKASLWDVHRTLWLWWLWIAHQQGLEETLGPKVSTHKKKSPRKIPWFMINAPRSTILILKAGLDQSQYLFEENVFSKLEISIQLLLLY